MGPQEALSTALRSRKKCFWIFVNDCSYLCGVNFFYDVLRRSMKKKRKKIRKSNSTRKGMVCWVILKDEK